MGIRSVAAALVTLAFVFGFAPSVLAAAPSREGLVAEYLFEGNSSDTSGNGHDAIAHGAVEFASSGGASLDGSSWFEVSTDPRFNLGSAATFTLKFRQDSTMLYGARLIDRITAGGGDGYLVDTYSPNGDGHRIRFIGGRGAVYADEPFDLGVWHVLAVRFDHGSVKIWVDGIEQGSGEVAITELPDNDLPIRIGASQGEYGGYEYLNGAVSDVRIYSRALSDDEIKALATDAATFLAAPDPYLSRIDKLRAASVSAAISDAISRKSRGDSARAKRTGAAFAAAVEARLPRVADLRKRAFFRAVAAGVRDSFR